METTFYQILSIDRSAALLDIKKAFYAKAKQCHPDVGGNKSEFQQINEAYETLRDPVKRAWYDFELQKTSAFQNQTFAQQAQEAQQTDEKPETEAPFSIFKLLVSLLFYFLIYWGITALGKLLNLEGLAHFVYFFVVGCTFLKSSK